MPEMARFFPSREMIGISPFSPRFPSLSSFLSGFLGGFFFLPGLRIRRSHAPISLFFPAVSVHADSISASPFFPFPPRPRCRRRFPQISSSLFPPLLSGPTSKECSEQRERKTAPSFFFPRAFRTLFFNTPTLFVVALLFFFSSSFRFQGADLNGRGGSIFPFFFPFLLYLQPSLKSFRFPSFFSPSPGDRIGGKR